jgi:phage baseplate assembly protein gpV
MEMFDQLLAATKDTGDILGLQYGIVADTRDPYNLNRIQVYDQAKGGKHKSGWLMRGLPNTDFSPPIPQVNELVVFGYIGGDPHHGCYLGLVVNNNNKPVGKATDWTLLLGGTKLEILADGAFRLTGSNEIVINGAKSVTIEAADRVKITATKIELEASDTLNIKAAKVIYQAQQIDLGSPSMAKLSGKDLVTVGGKDNQGHTIVDKGW